MASSATRINFLMQYYYLSFEVLHPREYGVYRNDYSSNSILWLAGDSRTSMQILYLSNISRVAIYNLLQKLAIQSIDLFISESMMYKTNRNIFHTGIKVNIINTS